MARRARESKDHAHDDAAAEQPTQPRPPAPWPGDSQPDWDAVDEAGWESFPASDPPAF